MLFLRSKKSLPIDRMSQHVARAQRAAIHMAQLPDHEYFFRYTSGRWLYNETGQLAARYVRFNVDALQRVAANAAGATRCVSMVKSNEGCFNKIFTLQFDNGSELIAKVPYPLVKPQHLCTASEVATMEYARTILGLPVPKVLDWSAQADGTDVGVEYILMEKIEGDELRRRYKNLRSEGVKLLDQVNGMERAFVARRFSQIGSLYYKEDVEPALQARRLYADGADDDDASDRFRIGPCVDWDIWRGTRADIKLDRGPWPNTLSFIRASVNIQQAWLKRFSLGQSGYNVIPRSPLDDSPETHIRLLDQFLAVVPHVLPPEFISFPVLWHTDLHSGNIIVKPEGTPDLLGIIDWQGMGIAPLFMQCVFAKFVRYTGDSRIVLPPGIKIPTLPPDFVQYSEDEQTFIKGQLRLGIFHKYYEASIIRHSPFQHAVHEYPHLELVMSPFYGSSRTWYEGAHRLLQYLIEIQEGWDDIAPGQVFPNLWNEQNIEQYRKEYARLTAYDDQVSRLIKELELEGDAWVSNERYEEVRVKCSKLQEGWDTSQNGGPFPFQDGAPSWFLS